MAQPASGAPVQLLVYRFAAGASFDGQLAGALERLEVDGSIRVLDVLFIRADPETGEPEAVQASGDGIGSILVSLLDFRLDSGARKRESEAALEGASGVPAADVRELAASLAPGAALAAVLVEHTWTRTLDDALSRTGGVPLLSRFVDAVALADVSDELRGAAGD